MKRTLAIGVLLIACSERGSTTRPSDTQAALGGSIAARVDDVAIPLSLVQSVADAQHVSAKDAARKIIDDEIAANTARKRGLETKNPTAWNLTATRAHIVVDRLRDQAVRAGAPTNEEVERLSDQHWAEVDRPPTARVIHALAMPKKADKPEQRASARKVADDLLAAVKDAKTDAEFTANAKAVAHPKDVDIRVEELPPFRSDGRVIGGGGMDATFAKAAYALPGPGAQTGLVETPFGWHVIRFVERLPEQRMSVEDRRKAFAEEVVAMRGRDAMDALMKNLLSKTRVEVSPAAQALMQSVPIANEQASNP